VIGRTLCGVSAILVPLAAHGQATSFWADIGSARIRYADSTDISALSVSPTFRAAGQRATLAAAGTLSRLTNAWSNSGLLTVSTRVGRAERFSTEVEGHAGGSLHSDGGRTGQYLASARARVEGPARGLWVGGGLGQSWDAELRNVIQGDLGAWIARGANSATLRVAPTRVNGTIGYADTFAWIQRVTARWQFDGTAGYRVGDPLPSLRGTGTTWGSAAATLWLKPRVGLVASAGSYPVDLLQGFPGGRFLSLSVRWRPSEPMGIPQSIQEDGPRSDVRAFGIERVAGETRRVRVLAPGASRVEIAGDFTQWDALALTPETGGWWTAILPISSGKHEVNVRVDGGGWRVPPGLVVVEDEFGGSSGMVLVP
jgi:hypothetical protein